MFRQYVEKPKFNSSASCDLLEIYQNAVKERSQRKGAGKSTCTFSPSGLRCERLQWFRLRGTEPDIIESPDTALDFMADIGTHIHEDVQRTLSKRLGDNWIPAWRYLKDHPIPYKCSLDANRSRYETFITITSPPVRFACDGIIRLGDTIYLLEIKTCDLKSMDSLEDVKPVHMDQIRGYSALLGIPNVLVLYVDRQNGTSKCFEHCFTAADHKSVIDKMFKIMDMAESNLAPDRLPSGDYMCSNCPYQNKCKEW